MTPAEWIDHLLARLADLGASDLVLEPTAPGEASAMVRIDGVRRVLDTCPAGGAAQALARLKALAGLPAYITDEAQDGRIDGTAFGLPGDLRLAVLPTVRGGRAALRLPALGALPAVDDLGLPAAVVAGLRAALRSPNGLVLISGPTGSGKTTTIHSLLRELAEERADKVLLSIEDPVERRIQGVTQVEVDHHRGFGFDVALRAALRQDADVLVVGEIRDQETAAAAIRAALGGHLVMSTVHAPRALDVVPRLREMGIADELLLPVLNAVLAQRLLRQIHQSCGGEGCTDCHGGLLGRVPVCDWLPLDHALRADLAAQRPVAVDTDMDHMAAELVRSRITTESERGRVLAAS